MKKPQLFDYLDYREFLSDYYLFQKEKDSHFSYRTFLIKAQISSPSFYKQICEGQRNLTETTTKKFAETLDFSAEETLFFFKLVDYNQAKTPLLKQKYFDELKEFSLDRPYSILAKEKLGFYQNWYFPVVREMACFCIPNAQQIDFQKLAALIRPRIKATEFQNALQWLLENQFLIQVENHFEQTQKNIHTGHTIDSLLVRRFNQKMLLLGADALDQLPTNQRFSSGITMGVSHQTYEKMQKEITLFQEKLMRMVDEDQENIDRVIQFNILLFPLNTPEN
jgi:uncharacterized protein (TIGR02147 family)